MRRRVVLMTRIESDAHEARPVETGLGEQVPEVPCIGGVGDEQFAWRIGKLRVRLGGVTEGLGRPIHLRTAIDLKRFAPGSGYSGRKPDKDSARDAFRIDGGVAFERRQPGYRELAADVREDGCRLLEIRLPVAFGEKPRSEERRVGKE